MRTVVLFLGLTTLLSWYLPLTAYFGFLPDDMFTYPRKTLTGVQYSVGVVVIQWLLPALVVIAYMWRSSIAGRVRAGPSTTLFTVCVAVFAGQWATKAIAAFVPGGGGLYAVSVLVGYFALPLKLLLLFSAVHVLTHLTYEPEV